MTAEVGDWIRFYFAGELVIGEVKYIKEIHFNKYYCTDIGEISEESILEIRKPNK